MTDISKYQRIRDFCQTNQVTLVAVTKGRSRDEVMALYEAGQRDFAENRVQALLQRINEVPADARWHLIGHLQSNKVAQLPTQLAMIQSFDRKKLLPLLDAYGRRRKQPISLLLQIHIAREATKFGMSYAEAQQLLESDLLQQYPDCPVVGLMGMASLTDDRQQVRQEFRGLRRFFDAMRAGMPSLQILSMGMSGDFRIAVEEGSTMVRIGSALFADHAAGG